MATFGKSLISSKTFWLNVIVAGLAIVDQATPFIPPAYIPAVLIGTNVANMVLRWITGQPINSVM